MWRSLRHSGLKSELSCHFKRNRRPYSSTSSSSGDSTKIVIGSVAFLSATAAGAIAYGHYDPKFRNLLETNIPYINHVYKYFDEDSTPASKSSKVSVDRAKETAISSGLLKKKIDRAHEKDLSILNTNAEIENKKNEATSILIEKEPTLVESSIKYPEINMNLQSDNPTENESFNIASKEKEVSFQIEKVIKSSEKTKATFDTTKQSIQKHIQCVYEVLDVPEGTNTDVLWKEAETAASDKNKLMKLATQQESHTKNCLKDLKVVMKSLEATSPLLQKCEETVKIIEKRLNDANEEVSSLKKESDVAINYQKLVSASKEQFRKELNIIFPNYIQGDTGKVMSDDDLNLLLTHAHRRIEQLQKQLARQQVEKTSADETLQELKTREKIISDSERQDFESAVSKRVALMKENFETELRQQLRRQAAAHSDHIQEVTKVQEQELERKFSLQLEEKLLHQKGVFISEVSGNIARLKGISAFLKAKAEFDAVSKKAQALWLACQAMNYKITTNDSGNLYPLGTDIAAVKIAADEDNEFIMSVLAAIPSEAVHRGVYTNDALKEQFHNIKKICRKVALIDENNNSLYRYFLSYLQSFLIIDIETIPKAEAENKIAVDPTEWDNYDILSRISYCLKNNDLEQALRYANQLSGQSKIVAHDWMNETRLFLETQLAVKALLAHAAAVGVQAYH